MYDTRQTTDEACHLCGVENSQHENVCPYAAKARSGTILRTTIQGTPVQWARARVGGDGSEKGQARQVSFHTAPAQKRYKNLVKDEANLAMLQARARREHDGKGAPLGVPIIFEALVYLPIPSSFTKAENLAARKGWLRPTGKPDLDNWLKLPMDGCEGIAYANDSQVVGFGRSGTWYAEQPRLELHIYYAAPGLPLDPRVIAWRLAWLYTEFETVFPNHPGYSDSEGSWDAVPFLRDLRAAILGGRL